MRSNHMSKSKRRLPKPIALTIVLLMITIGALIKYGPFQLHFAETDRMNPGFPSGSVLIKRIASPADGSWEPKPGDLVIADRIGPYPELRRVVGVPGDRIAVRGGRVIRNDLPLVTPDSEGKHQTVAREQDTVFQSVTEELCGVRYEVVLPRAAVAASPQVNMRESRVAGHEYFVLTDNRDIPVEYPARMIGKVSFRSIQGYVLVQLWPSLRWIGSSGARC